MDSDDKILAEFKTKNPWGLHLTIDLTDCDPEIIRNQEKIKQFVLEICELIEMKRFGETVVVHFGEDPRVCGFSMTQLIETSLISGHFAEDTNSAYIDIFSCKYYSPQKAVEFTKNFFKATKIQTQIIFRG